MESESLIIKFPPELGGATKTFSTPKEFRKWIGEEREALQKFGEGQNNGFLWRSGVGTGQGWATIPTLNQLDGHCNDWERDIANPGPHQRNGLRNAKNTVEAYSNGQAIARDSSAIQAIRAYWERGYTQDDAIGYGIAILKQPLIEAARYYRGFIHGTIAAVESLPFADGDRARVAKAAAESEALQEKLEALFRSQIEAAETAKSEWTTLVQQSETEAAGAMQSRRDETAALAKEHENILSTLAINTGEVLNKSGKDVDDFKARLKTEIALGFPITHWQKKAKYHKWFFWGSLVAFLILAVLFAWGIYSEGSALMDQIGKIEKEAVKEAAPIYGPQLPGAASSNEGGAKSGIPLHFLRLGILILSITLGFWFLRFVARILLSSLHLSDDATERVVMIKTFLAFNEAKVGLSPEDVKLALASVFRPATSGLVGDDGIPPGIWDAITRLKPGS